MSEQFRGPYNTFFHGKSKDAWEDSDSYTYRFWNTKDKCYLPREAWTERGARENREPMIEYCNCMMDLWKTRNPAAATAPALETVETSEMTQVEELPAHEEVESIEEPQTYPNASLATDTAPFLTPSPARKDPMPQGMTFLPPREEKPLNGTSSELPCFEAPGRFNSTQPQNTNEAFCPADELLTDPEDIPHEPVSPQPFCPAPTERPFFESQESLTDPEEAFVQKYEEAEQCPTTDEYIQHQADKGYFGWGIDKMRRLFGSERDLSLKESRHGFYHEEVLKKIPKMVKGHPAAENGEPTREVVRDMSTLRDTVRDYTRERSWKVAKKWLDWMEPRGHGFDYYWNKYKGNATKVLEGTMRSNPKYDDPEYLDGWDRWLSALDFSSPSSTKAKLQPISSSSTTRTDGFQMAPLPLERRVETHEQGSLTSVNDTSATEHAPSNTTEAQEIALMMPQIQTPHGTSTKFDSPIFQNRNGTFCPSEEPIDTPPDPGVICPEKPTNGTDVSEAFHFEAPVLTSSKFDSPKYQNVNGTHCPWEALKHPFARPEQVEHPTSSPFDSPKYQNVSGTLCPWKTPKPMFTAEEPAAPVVYPVCETNSWEAWGHYALKQTGKGLYATGSAFYKLGAFLGNGAINGVKYLATSSDEKPLDSTPQLPPPEPRGTAPFTQEPRIEPPLNTSLPQPEQNTSFVPPSPAPGEIEKEPLPFGPVERPVTYPNDSLVTDTATPELPEEHMFQGMTFVPSHNQSLTGSNDTCPSGLATVERQEAVPQDMPVIPQDKPANISVVEDEQPRTLNATPEEHLEDESIPQEVTPKVVVQPKETTPTFTAQPLDPEREASEVSRDCIRLGNQLSEQYRKPYSEFFHDKPADAWGSSDSYTYRFWDTKDKCYLLREAWTERGARENREPMIEYCNCMMDLWKTRNPVAATAPALETVETSEMAQVEELPAHEEVESIEEPQTYPNASLVTDTAPFLTPSPARKDPIPQGMTFIPPREEKPLNGTTCPSGLSVPEREEKPAIPTTVEEPQAHANVSVSFDPAKYFAPRPRTDVCPLRDEQCSLVDEPQTYPNMSFVPHSFDVTGYIAPRVNISALRDDQCGLTKPAHLNDTLIVTPSPAKEPEEEVVISPPVVQPNISEAEEEQPRRLDAVPQERVEDEHVSEEVTAKVIPKPEDTARSFTAQHLDPEREASEVSRDCIRLGNQLSEHYRKPYSEFFHDKPAVAWSPSDSYTYRFWNTRDKCYLPPEVTTPEAARQRREPMIEYCNCMMDLWKTRNPSVQAGPVLEADEASKMTQIEELLVHEEVESVEELPAHEEVEPVEEPQTYPNASLVTDTAPFLTPSPMRKDPMLQGMTLIPPREEKPLNGTTCPSGLPFPEREAQPAIPTKVEEPQTHANVSVSFDPARYFAPRPRTDVCPLRNEQCSVVEETLTYPNMSFVPHSFDVTGHIVPSITESVLRDDQCGLIKPAHLNDTVIATPSPAREPEEKVVISPPVVQPNISVVKEEQPRTLDTSPEEEVVIPAHEEEPASVTVVREEEPITTTDSAPQERVIVEEEPAPQEVPAKVDVKPEEAPKKPIKAQYMDPSQEASIVSQECRKLGRTLSDRYKTPYDEFFSGKPADAWGKYDYTHGWTSTAPCPMPAKAYNADTARKRKGPMVEFCNCMMDLWKTRHPEVPATT